MLLLQKNYRNKKIGRREVPVQKTLVKPVANGIKDCIFPNFSPFSHGEVGPDTFCEKRIRILSLLKREFWSDVERSI